MSFKYDGCLARIKFISGILAEFEKKVTFGSFARVNLNPIGER